MAKATYYVIDAEDNTLWEGKEKDDGPQKFNGFVAAEKRAKEAAECEPGKEFKIVRVEAIVSCGVNPPTTTKIE